MAGHSTICIIISNTNVYVDPQTNPQNAPPALEFASSAEQEASIEVSKDSTGKPRKSKKKEKK